MIEKIKNEIHKIVIGHEELVDAMLMALLSEGHIFVEGLPGVAKTTAVNTLAKVLGFDFKRVQFTPDLLPLDITGNEILDLTKNSYKIKHGPIFTNLLLADEINRAGAKVQSALLEAMAEKQVTIGEKSFKLNDPFMVLATANPIDQEGTYNLPEASLDRFMLKVNVGYNSIEEEFLIVKKVADKKFEKVESIVSLEQFKQMQQESLNIHIDDELLQYILEIIFATREPKKYGLDEYIEFGASPRASIDLYKATKAHAYLQGKDYATPYNVAKSAFMALRHRIKLTYKAKVEQIDADTIIEKILEKVIAP